MATALSNLLALLALDESAYISGLNSSKKATDSFADQLASVGGSIAVAALTAVGTAVVAVGTAAFDAAETVDEAFDNIAIKTGAQGDELAQLQEDWKAVFSSIPVDAGAAADAIGMLNARLDISGEPLQNLAANMLELSRVTKSDLVPNVENFTRVIGDWNVPVEDAAGALDKLFVASQSTGADLGTLMDQVVQYGAPMRNFGFSFEESAALLASFAAQGVNTEIVMSGLRIAQGKFITQGKDMNTGLWETVDAIQNAASTTDALAIATEIFGAKAAGDMVDTIRAGKFDLDALVDSMMNADGAIRETAASTSDWGETWKTFQNNMTLALAPIGEKIREAMGGALDQLLEVFNRPDVQAAMTNFANFAAAAITSIVQYIPTVIDGFFQFVEFLKNNEGILVGVFTALAVAVGIWAATSIAAAWSTITAMLPIILVLVLIAAAAYLLYEAWTNNWGGIQEKTAAVFAWLQEAFTAVVAAINAIWQNPMLQLIWQTTLSNIRFIWEAFKAAFNGDWTAFGANLRVVWDNNWRLIALVVQNIVPTIISHIKSLISNIINTFQNTNWREVGMNIIRGIAGGITGSASLIAEAAKSAANAALEAAKGFLGIKSPSKLFENEIGANMALGMVAGWENILNSNPLTPALATATVDMQPAAVSPLGAAAMPFGAPAENNGDEELKRMLRDLPQDVARAIRDAMLKTARK